VHRPLERSFHGESGDLSHQLSGRNGLGWNLDKLGTVTDTAPFSNQTLDNRYEGDPYYYIERTTATGHNGCVGYDIDSTTPAYGDLAWEPCGADNTKWVWSATNFLANIHSSDQSGQPVVVSVPSNPSGGYDDLNGTDLILTYLVGPHPCNEQFTQTPSR
jgi:hypothetical protein